MPGCRGYVRRMAAYDRSLDLILTSLVEGMQNNADPPLKPPEVESLANAYAVLVGAGAPPPAPADEERF